MATAKMLEFIIGLIITIIVFGAIFGCVNKFLNPKCDLRAVDAFNDFNALYNKCMDININKICKCGEFDIRDLPLEHKIIVSPAIKDEKEVIRSSLICNGLTADKEHFESQGNERIRVYFYDIENFNLDKTLEALRGYIGAKVDTDNIKERVKGLKESGLPISEDILNEGFEIDATNINRPEAYPIDIKSLFRDNLTLVNYNGQTAFLATTKKQEEYLKDNPLLNCF